MRGKDVKATLGWLAAASFMLFGRYLAAAVVSKRKGEKLSWRPSANRGFLTCPSGNMLYVEIDGPADGTPLVFVHGVNADHTQWYYQRKYFNGKYRLVFLDLPMHLINASNYKLDIATLASDINSVLNQLNITGALLYGHSMGGTILMEYCLRYPGNNMKGLILQSAPYTDPVHLNAVSAVSRYLRNPVLIPALNFIKKHSTFFDVLSHLSFLNGLSVFIYRYVHFTGTQTAAELLYVTAMAPRNHSGAIAESVLQLMRYEAGERLQHIRLPVMIISGKKDRLNIVACGEYIHHHIKGSQFVVVPAGHQSMVENAQLINAAIEKFIEQLRAD